MALTDKLYAIGNAIRAKSGKTALIPLASMPDEIAALKIDDGTLDKVLTRDTKLTAIESGVEEIGQCALYCCSGLVSAVFKNAMVIRDSALYNCYNLESIDAPNVTSIEGNAFRSCSKLTSLNTPLVNTLGEYAFWSCTSLASVDMPNVSSASRYSFQYCRALQEISLPNLTTAGDYTFANCDSLKTANLPNLTSVNSYMFQYCSKLETVNLPEVTTLNYYAFRGCAALNTLRFAKVTYAYSSAFSNCGALKTLSLPSIQTLSGEIDLSGGSSSFDPFDRALLLGADIVGTSIASRYPGNNAFKSFEAVILLGTTPPTLPSSTPYFFNSTSGGINSGTSESGIAWSNAIYVPDSAVDTYKAATGWSAYASAIKGISELPERIRARFADELGE